MDTIKPWNCPITRARQMESIRKRARQHRHIQTWINKVELKVAEEAPQKTNMGDRLKARMKELMGDRAKATA